MNAEGVRELLVAMLLCGGDPSPDDMQEIYFRNASMPVGTLQAAWDAGFVENGGLEVTDKGKAFVRGDL